MTPEVEEAVAEVRRTFDGHRIEVVDEAQGGAYVTVHDVPVGDAYAPAATWAGFLIPFQYPRADVYPHFVDAALARRNGQPHGEGFSASHTWQGKAAIQVSRRSNRWDPSTDTAAGKLLKVIEWVRSR